MQSGLRHEQANTLVLVHGGLPVLLTWSLLGLAFVVPHLDSTRPPFVDLSSDLAEAFYWVAESGGKLGITLLMTLMLAILVSRAGLSLGRRWLEGGVLASVILVCAGGGAWLNEHFIKAELQVPRPNIVALAGQGGQGPLGATPREFYALGDKAARSEALAQVLNREPPSVSLSPVVKRHWILETGYSFPSGHASAALFAATFFVLMGVTYVTCRRRWLLYALLPWALAVSFSRPILRVHTPTDIMIGGLQGMLLGVIAWWIARQMLRRFG